MFSNPGGDAPELRALSIGTRRFEAMNYLRAACPGGRINRGLGLSRELAACFRDTRDQRFVDHSGEQLLDQRLYGLALGYEDLNDHERLRLDPLLAVACEKQDPFGQDRFLPDLLLERLRELTLQGTALARATAGTIRLKLLKVAAEVKVSVRRVYVRFCSAFPMQEIFSRCLGASTP